MTKRMDARYQALALTLAFSVLAVAPCQAAKGGKGGGKPGGEDPPPPPAAPVSYSVTPVQMPGTGYYFNDNNENAAVVGWTSGGLLGKRAMAYLPSISSAQAFYLDDPSLGVTGIPDLWHTGSAIGIIENCAAIEPTPPLAS